MTVDVTFTTAGGRPATFTHTLTTPLSPGDALAAIAGELDRLAGENS